MDVRCEKCGTEYELDEARLKPGGVTVKCTNCGHMFKIRKRAPTNVGAPPPDARPRAASNAPASRAPQADSGRARAADSGRLQSLRSPTEDGVERQWIIRLDNGEQKTCRELATLQQWIVSGMVSRESMISRSGKTWKRLGDIAELSSFFIVADEARQQRMSRDSGRITPPSGMAPRAADDPRSTQLGVAAPTVSLGRPREEATQVAVPRPVGDAGSRPSPKLDTMSTAPGRPDTVKTPLRDPQTATTSTGLPAIPARAAQTQPTAKPAAPARPQVPSIPVPAKLSPRPATPAPVMAAPPVAPPKPPRPTTPMPPPPAARPAPSVPPPAPPPMPPAPPPALPSDARATGGWAQSPIVAKGERATGAWATEDVAPIADDDEAGPKGPVAGKLSVIADEPAFAATARMSPISSVAGPPPMPEASFGGFGADRAPERGIFDEDSAPVAAPRSGSAGKWIAIASLVVIGGAAAAVYFGVIRGKSKGSGATEGTDNPGSGTAAVVAIDAGAIVAAPTPDAAPVVTDDAVAAARAELLGDVEGRLAEAGRQLATHDQEPGAQALAARIATAQAQALEDRAALTTDKKLAADLHKKAQQQLLDAVRLAQRALKTGPRELAAQVAMADVLRLQARPARDVHRYLDPALAAKDREAQLVSALLDLRDGKREPAKAALQALDTGDGALEQSGDVRPRFRLAMIAFAAGDGAAARALVDQVLALHDDHDGAKALRARVADAVATSDPLPPEERDAGVGPGSAGSGSAGSGSAGSGSAGSGAGSAVVTPPGGGGGDNYDALLTRANALATDGDCGHALELFQKALAQKPGSVEALTGAGFCYIDSKQFASAHSSFRAALGISPRFERALWGIAEAYQQQGLRDRALEAYQRYLEVYPDSAAAKRQVDRLGGGTPDPGPGSGTGTGSGTGSSEPAPGSGGGTPDPGPASGAGPASGPGPASGAGSSGSNDPFNGN